ncbi:SIR2 family protein [Aliarcobacter butzleri]|uniref:SIR2 family protein n=1 Tax=Aliarcobacter butzleri TaxID=28197 RepID=UPI0024DE1F82|nr:SIR2 family protein [Aliarcobacter butzleri]MDK2084284.1 SIR2 family protein [Aliarcobacter butzleri]
MKESLVNIKKFYNNEQLSLFVGAGVSIESELPNWNDLINELKKELNTKENDFLKIAQLYFLQFGENIYYKKLLEKFDLSNKKPNELIDSIVKMRCKNIVTTNWDDLLEKSISNYGMFYDVVKNSDDFSNLGINTNLLIKMHGDLLDRNIVFKEDDYLSYSDNFSLIELFVKSIFIRSVVLFVGYSVSDFNVKQLITWVQNRTNQNLPIYFLEVRKDFDYLEFTYYKSKNIYILYTKSLFKNANEVLKEIKGEITTIFSEKKVFLESVYNALKPFENHNYISGYDIKDTLKSTFSLYGINEIIFLAWGKPNIFIQTKEIKTLLQSFKISDFKEDKRLLEITKSIYKIFRKSIISSISDFNTQKTFFSFKTNFTIDDSILFFDKKSIKKQLIEYNKDNLKKAYLEYNLENYYESYQTLKKASLEYFKQRDYSKYLISEYNIKKFCNLLRFGEEKYDKGFKVEIENICKNINNNLFTDIYYQLPKAVQLAMKNFIDIDRFEEKKKNYTQYLLKDVVEKGENRFDYTVPELYYFNLDLIANINTNYLLINHTISGIYSNIFETVIYQYQYKKIKWINYEFIFVGILGYSSWKELYKFLKDKNILILSEGSKLNDNLKKTYENLLNTYLEQAKLYDIYEQYFTNYFIILNFSELSKEDISLMASSIIEIFNRRLMKWSDYELIDVFISKYKDRIDENILKSILEIFLDKFICNRFNVYDIEIIDRVNIFSNIFDSLKEKNIKIDTKKIQSYINKVDNMDKRTKFKIYSKFLTGLSQIVDKKFEIELNEKLINFSEELKNFKEVKKFELVNSSFEIDYVYLYYEYLLILDFYTIQTFDKEKELEEYVSNYDGWNSEFVNIFNMIKILQKKNNNQEFLKSIENIFLELNEKYNKKFF